MAEVASDIQAHLLDVIYKTSGEVIESDKVLRVLALADKYVAPSVIQACRYGVVGRGPPGREAVCPSCCRSGPDSSVPAGACRASLCSPDFEMGPALTTSPPEAPTAQPCPFEIMCMAGRYSFDDLFMKGAHALVKSMTNPESAGKALDAMKRWETPLQAHLDAKNLFTLGLGVARRVEAMHAKAAVEAKAGEAERLAAATARELEKERSKYASLLRKHNQLLGKAQTMGLLGLLKRSGGPGGI